MNYITMLLCSTVIIGGICASTCSGQTPPRTLESAIAANDSLLAALAEEKNELAVRLEAKRGEITELKGKAEIGFLQRRRLEGLLKEFQLLSMRADTLDRQARDVSEQLTALRFELWQAYQGEINNLLSALAADIDRITEADRRRSLEQISTLRRKKIALTSQLDELPPSIEDPLLLTIESTDDYTRVKEKGDRLKDSEDRLRQDIKQIDKKMTRFRGERGLREKLGDFLDDVSLFEQRDEAVTSAQQATKTAVENATNWFDINYGRGSMAAGETSAISNIGENLWKIDPSFLTSEEMELILQLFEEYRGMLAVRADSLGARAARFYEKAEELRRHPKGKSR